MKLCLYRFGQGLADVVALEAVFFSHVDMVDVTAGACAEEKHKIVSANQQKKEETQGMLFNINISAVDAKSFNELCRRNPEALTGPIEDAI